MVHTTRSHASQKSFSKCKLDGNSSSPNFKSAAPNIPGKAQREALRAYSFWILGRFAEYVTHCSGAFTTEDGDTLLHCAVFSRPWDMIISLCLLPS